MKINKIFEWLAKTKPGQKVYKWCAEGNHDRFLNNTLPQVETVLSTACYVWSTAKQKNIEKDQRDLLQIQNIGSGIVGLGLGTAANHWISKQTDKIVKDLDPKVMDPKALRKVSTGLRVFAPILVTGTIMRFILPSIVAGFSGKVMDREREKRQAMKKLDVKV